MKERFTWIPMYKALSDWLHLGKDNQTELISILKDIGITDFRDSFGRMNYFFQRGGFAR